jgi:hypothetical protein
MASVSVETPRPCGTIREVAARHPAIGERGIRAGVRDGAIPYYRPPSTRPFIYDDEVDAYVATCVVNRSKAAKQAVQRDAKARARQQRSKQAAKRWAER